MAYSMDKENSVLACWQAISHKPYAICFFLRTSGASRLTSDEELSSVSALAPEALVESNMSADLDPLSMVSMHASTANHSGQGFPTSAHRTGHAVFPHPALGRVSHRSILSRPQMVAPERKLPRRGDTSKGELLAFIPDRRLQPSIHSQEP